MPLPTFENVIAAMNQLPAEQNLLSRLKAAQSTLADSLAMYRDNGHSNATVIATAQAKIASFTTAIARTTETIDRLEKIVENMLLIEA